MTSIDRYFEDKILYNVTFEKDKIKVVFGTKTFMLDSNSEVSLELNSLFYDDINATIFVPELNSAYRFLIKYCGKGIPYGRFITSSCNLPTKVRYCAVEKRLRSDAIWRERRKRNRFWRGRASRNVTDPLMRPDGVVVLNVLLRYSKSDARL